MGCWGTGIASDDEFWDLVSNLQKTLKWKAYDGNPETMITAKHFDEHYGVIEERIRQGFTPSSNNFESCWFQVVAFLVMKIGAKMSKEMRDSCMLASRIENDYLDQDGWLKREDFIERAQALEKFASEIDQYYSSSARSTDNNLKDY